MLENARQIYHVIKETFNGIVHNIDSDSDCVNAESNQSTMSCMWFDLNKNASQISTADRLQDLTKVDLLEFKFRVLVADPVQFLKHGHRIMINAANKYDLGRLYLGIGVAILAAAALVPCITSVTQASWVFLSACFMTFLYGIMMFASSFVEEEHNFWYWIASGCCGWLFLRK